MLLQAAVVKRTNGKTFRCGVTLLLRGESCGWLVGLWAAVGVVSTCLGEKQLQSMRLGFDIWVEMCYQVVNETSLGTACGHMEMVMC